MRNEILNLNPHMLKFKHDSDLFTHGLCYIARNYALNLEFLFDTGPKGLAAGKKIGKIY